MARRHPDQVAVEEPMSIHLDDHLVATTMRTPGHDFELAVGFCFTDGLLAGAGVRTCRYCGTGSAGRHRRSTSVSVDTGGHAPVPVARLRSDLVVVRPVRVGLARRAGRPARSPAHELSAIPLGRGAGRRWPGRVRSEQQLVRRHRARAAAAAFDRDRYADRWSSVRTSVGTTPSTRWWSRLLLDDRLPGRPISGLYVSGRASFELVQKAWAAGFAAVVAVSAPTVAGRGHRRARPTSVLAGFVRSERMSNVYAGTL